MRNFGVRSSYVAFHHETKVRRRLAHGIKNFERYKMLVDSWQLYDNSGAPPILLDES